MCVCIGSSLQKTIGMNHDCVRKVSLLSFRNSFEENGERYLLERIALFGKCNVLIIPNNVNNVGERNAFMNINLFVQLSL
jgi:hypothetical protein